MWLNALTDGKGISHKYSPKQIVTGRHIYFKNNQRVVFRSYVEAHNDPKITNNMAPRTHECIALGTTRNIQVTHKVFFYEFKKSFEEKKNHPHDSLIPYR